MLATTLTKVLRRGGMPAVAAALALAVAVTTTACTEATDVATDNPVAAVRITPQVAVQVVHLGKSFQLTATCFNAADRPVTGRTITWTSGNTAVASVSSSGLVTAHMVGVAALSAECENRAAQITIQVTLIPVVSVTVTPNNPTVQVGFQQQLTAVPRDSANNILTLEGRSVSWTSSNLPVAFVSPFGVLGGVSQGTAIVQATVDGVPSAPITATVNNVPVASVQIEPTGPFNQTLGSSRQLDAVLRDANNNLLSKFGRVITWTSSDPSVVSITVNGLIVAEAKGGPVTISVTCEGKTNSIQVLVP